MDDYPGKDITELATEALRLLHILSGSYFLPLNLGSKLLKKVTNTSSEFFNRKMYSLLDSARTLETRYRLKDPITKKTNLFQCYRCKQWGRKATNPVCPQFSKRNPKPTSKSSQDQSATSRMKPKVAWKYVKSKDISQPIEIDDKKWCFCRKCKCRATGRVGHYQLLHTDDTHDPYWRPEGNVSPIVDPDPTPAPPHRPPLDNPPNNDLVFTGVNHTPVYASQPRHCKKNKNLTNP